MKLTCRGPGAPGVFSFTPTADMPDTLYYQSYNHDGLGGVIRLVDRCKSEKGKIEVSTFRPDLKAHVEEGRSDDKVSLLRNLIRARSERIENSIRKEVHEEEEENAVEDEGKILLSNLAN